jgi:TadE-like protein
VRSVAERSRARRTTTPLAAAARSSPGTVTAGERGSAVVDFALVGALLTLVFLSVVQLGLLVHVRNTLVDCAAEGARYGARADRSPSDAVERTRVLIVSELSSGYAARVGTRITAAEVDRGGARAVEVRLSAPLPVVGLAGPSGLLSVAGHAYAERQ